MKYRSNSNDQKSTFCCGILASVAVDDVPDMCEDVILPSVVVVDALSLSRLFFGVTVPIASS